MSTHFKTELIVSDDVVDINGHVNNVRYIQWMQDIAVAHSEFVGCHHHFYQSLGASWVARSHHINYLMPAFLNDSITINTWIDRFRKVSCFRKYEFRRESDEALLATAETEWVFVSIDSGRPKKIDADVVKRFQG